MRRIARHRRLRRYSFGKALAQAHSKWARMGMPSSLPVGQNSQTVGQGAVAKIFHFTEIRICRTDKTPWPETRGGSRSSRTAGRAAMDATASGAISVAGRLWP